MNKLMKVAVASTLVVTMLAGCSSTPAAKYAKVGLGVVSSFNEETNQVNTTMAAVALDKDGKIAYIDLDVAQSTPTDEKKALTETKKERGEAYGMKGSSPIGAEWNEQAAALEEYCLGKTPAEVAGMELDDYHGGKAPAAGTDLASKCTITIDDFLAAIEKAVANAKEVEADKVGVGEVMANNADKAQVDTTIALVATDANGKVVYTKLDVAQIYKGVTETKGERKEAYGMKETSAKNGKIENGGEWYEQAAAFEAFTVGKTLEEVAAVEVEDYHGGKAPATGSDLASKCTITIDAFLEAIAEAGANLK